MTKKAFPMGEIYLALLFFGSVALVLWLFYSSHLGMNSIKNLSIQNYGNWFIFATIISSVVIAIEFYRNNIIDRAIWAFTLFFCISSVVYLSNVPTIVHYYDLYASTILFLSLGIVGIVTTFFAPAGFVGVLSDDKKAVQSASFKLLGIIIFGVIWSVWARGYWLQPLILPVILWRWAYDVWGRQLRGEKSGWSFKW